MTGPRAGEAIAPCYPLVGKANGSATPCDRGAVPFLQEDTDPLVALLRAAVTKNSSMRSSNTLRNEHIVGFSSRILQAETLAENSAIATTTS